MAEKKCRYWLAEQIDVHTIRLADGCHDGPEGVAEARKLIGRIFGDRFKKGEYVMVTVQPVPDLDPPINEQAAQDCADLVDRFGDGA